ncbi:hypothetical protein T265_07725 [Opisthorchis viverrini]|uniref:Uncharacterized protein n=1 Tax=Opisthorchis viverrini TaxID=6198 RepID=A0A074ZMY4_OPIVI|nr:hypothetical protein T265_07725 [Opisthorchis viverrini]KER24680.1 hypothetical protein T265_07725 [Opisthorchis viverrini]
MSGRRVQCFHSLVCTRQNNYIRTKRRLFKRRIQDAACEIRLLNPQSHFHEKIIRSLTSSPSNYALITEYYRMPICRTTLLVSLPVPSATLLIPLSMNCPYISNMNMQHSQIYSEPTHTYVFPRYHVRFPSYINCYLRASSKSLWYDGISTYFSRLIADLHALFPGTPIYLLFVHRSMVTNIKSVIYDEFYDSSTFELQPLLDKLKPELERTRWLAQDTVNTSFVFLLRSYDLSQLNGTMYRRNTLLMRLLKILRQPTTGFALLGAHQSQVEHKFVWTPSDMKKRMCRELHIPKVPHVPDSRCVDAAYLTSLAACDHRTCALLAERVRAILSLTSCAVAKRIELYTKPRKIMHVAIPKPICPDKSYPTKDPPYDTVWLQPSMDHIIRVLQDLARMEKIPRAYLLTDGTSAVDTVYQSPDIRIWAPAVNYQVVLHPQRRRFLRDAVCDVPLRAAYASRPTSSKDSSHNHMKGGREPEAVKQ